MRKFICFLLVFSLILLVGCQKQENSAAAQEEDTFDYAGFEWEGYLRTEAYDDSSVIGSEIAKAAKISVDDVTDAQITVTVEAPNVCEALMDWYDSVSGAEFSEEALENKILELLKGGKVSNTFTMTYTLVDGEPVIGYAEGYADALSCGLTDFYDVLNERILESMGGGADG